METDVLKQEEQSQDKEIEQIFKDVRYYLINSNHSNVIPTF